MTFDPNDIPVRGTVALHCPHGLSGDCGMRPGEDNACASCYSIQKQRAANAEIALECERRDPAHANCRNAEDQLVTQLKLAEATVAEKQRWIDEAIASCAKRGCEMRERRLAEAEADREALLTVLRWHHKAAYEADWDWEADAEQDGVPLASRDRVRFLLERKP